MHDCNCSFCRKAGALWGYFLADQVERKGEVLSTTRPGNKSPAIQIDFCPACGSTVTWSLTQAVKNIPGVEDQMGVNMRLFEPSDLAGVELRFPDGKNWSGEGPFEYRKESVSLGQTGEL